MSRPDIKRFYTRSDPRGLFPYLTGERDLAHNRLAHFWRPVIDLSDSAVAPLRLRMVAPLVASLARGESRWLWYSMVGVPGLRHQVLRHAGLPEYDCREPGGLPPELRSVAWNNLIRYIGRFPSLDPRTRAMVLFQLTQLSYVQVALRLAGDVTPSGDHDHDRYALEVARLHARYPGHAARALRTFAALAAHEDRLIAVSAWFQGIGHSLRANDLERAAWFAAHPLPGGLDDWYGVLVRSRLYRALAMWHLRLGDRDAALRAMHHAFELDRELRTEPAEPLVAEENTRTLLELRIQATGEGMDELLALDPYCVEARLSAGDGYASRGDLLAAARCYALAGELATGSGAVGWYRAGQCYHLLGDTGMALHAMGRCLELDRTAVEPREYMSRTAGSGMVVDVRTP